MTIDLTARELSDILEGLDNAIECMADWSHDELNTAGYRRGMRPKTLKFWCLVNKLIVYTPNHYMAVSVKGASRGSGATVTLDGTELGSNGKKPGTTKLTNNAAGTHPPRDLSSTSLEGRSTQSVGRESRWGVSASHADFRPAVPKGSATLDIANRLWRGVFVSSQLPKARRRPLRRLVPSA
jgi:hypothetical protein